MFSTSHDDAGPQIYGYCGHLKPVVGIFVKIFCNRRTSSVNGLFNMRKDNAMSTLILQLSDFHLKATPTVRCKGVTSVQTLKMLFTFIKTQFPDNECCILTGDIADDYTNDMYTSLRTLLLELSLRYYLIPGNHDDRSEMVNVFSDRFKNSEIAACFSVSVGGWTLIGLDSYVDGEAYGRLGNIQLRWLHEQIDAHGEEPMILFMHHPPVPVGSPWLDRIGLKESNYFEEILTSSKRVQAICVGHIHQEFEGKYAGIQVLGTPSMSVQFRPNTLESEIDPIPPGFRLLELADDSFTTRVVRLTRRLEGR